MLQVLLSGGNFLLYLHRIFLCSIQNSVSWGFNCCYFCIWNSVTNIVFCCLSQDCLLCPCLNNSKCWLCMLVMIVERIVSIILVRVELSRHSFSSISAIKSNIFKLSNNWSYSCLLNTNCSFSWIYSTLIVLFCSRSFQRFAVKTSKQIEDISTKGRNFKLLSLHWFQFYFIYCWAGLTYASKTGIVLQLHRRSKNLQNKWKISPRILMWDVSFHLDLFILNSIDVTLCPVFARVAVFQEPLMWSGTFYGNMM